jgi:hypothetical protein
MESENQYSPIKSLSEDGTSEKNDSECGLLLEHQFVPRRSSRSLFHRYGMIGFHGLLGFINFVLLLILIVASRSQKNCAELVYCTLKRSSFDHC